MPSPTIADRLRRVVPQLDQLQAEVELGIRSARHLDDLEERAQAIAEAVVAPFRKPLHPTRPPLHTEKRPGGRTLTVW